MMKKYKYRIEDTGKEIVIKNAPPSGTKVNQKLEVRGDLGVQAWTYLGEVV